MTEWLMVLWMAVLAAMAHQQEAAIAMALTALVGALATMIAVRASKKK